MILSDVESTRQELENEELKSSDGVATTEVYAKLMACYLLENDLCSAKFLWKRAPAAAKETEGALAALWAVGQKLWTKDSLGVYVALRREWPEYLQPAVGQLEGVIRERALSLVSRAYTSITLSDLSALVGLPTEEAAKLATERGWVAEGDMVLPRTAPQTIQQTSNCQQALTKLTQYVSFLEN